MKEKNIQHHVAQAVSHLLIAANHAFAEEIKDDAPSYGLYRINEALDVLRKYTEEHG